MKRLFLIALGTCQFVHLLAQNISRGPYLQQGNQSSVIIRWRTDIPTDTKIQYGLIPGVYNTFMTSGTLTTEHEIPVSGLLPDTKYYYSIGTSTTVLQGSGQNYFVTAPLATTTRKQRFIAFGDCGNNSANQVAVRKAMRNFLGDNNPDAWILMGDNAYSTGQDEEYQTNFFDIYKDSMLKNIKLFPSPGNHDYGNTQANAALRNIPYFTNFTLPAAAECGGTASGTEAYYSFDIGNVHLIALDSYGKEDTGTTRLYDTLGAQVSWLKNDLAVNTKPWVVVYFHHPPFTKGSHNSDVSSGADLELRYIRENFIRIIERYGVDLVLCGHSHSYERTFLQKGFYQTEDLYNSSFKVSNSSGAYNNSSNSCPYYTTSQKNNHGTIYAVSGSSGQLGGTSAGYPHEAMYYSDETNGGAFYFEVQENRLDAKFICADNIIRDQFTIMKDVNKKMVNNVLNGATVQLTASYIGTYHWIGAAETTRTFTVTPPVNSTTTYIVHDNIACVADTFLVNTIAVLPVKLEYFKVSPKNNYPVLQWKAFADDDTKEYLLEKSTDGNNFTLVKKVAAKKGSNAYSLTDANIYNNPVTYKLSAVNSNGRILFLGSAAYIPSKVKSFGFTITPYKNYIKLQLNSLKRTNTNLHVVATDGKLMFAKNVLASIGVTSIDIPLNAGSYFIRCDDGYTAVTQKIHF
jgi:3',5'-cyclic AMP phosphodiesterase CpdA